MNRLTKAADHTTGRKAHYTYNGIGQRTAKTISYITETVGTATDNHTEDYLLDLTKPYHNLIGLQRDGKRQTFYYDGNLSAMEEDGQLHYYLLDEEYGFGYEENKYDTTSATYFVQAREYRLER